MRKYAAELVGAAPEVILAQTTPVTAALLRETRKTPIVFVIVSDPVGSGFVETLSHPGGNATGSSIWSLRWSRSGLNYSRRLRLRSHAQR
jgi:ABC-type uncharacterized transport system substrate-binding protein